MTPASRFYYRASIGEFLQADPNAILGTLADRNEFELLQTQRDAWREQIAVLRDSLNQLDGSIYLEYSIPRMGKRVDAILLIGPVIFVVEFKVGEDRFSASAVDQVFDYALDLKHFHESSHNAFVSPILIATKAAVSQSPVQLTPQNDRLYFPLKCGAGSLHETIETVLSATSGPPIDPAAWEAGRYCPTPTIVEAAIALYRKHSVDDISRNDASAINLGKTSAAVATVIRDSRNRSRKSMCFVTGVPGAGKTLVGLNIATMHLSPENALYSVFLSGNDPLVEVLREALTRDMVANAKERGETLTKGAVKSEVKTFIQNVHHFRDDCLNAPDRPPVEHVALFDEAQRAWNVEKTTSFMAQKKGRLNFSMSEPEFLIECLDRHADWAVIVCLVGGGQEINTGEAGISEWISALNRRFQNWDVFISPRLTDSEYAGGKALEDLKQRSSIKYIDELHLSVSMRSFRSERVSLLVKQLLDLEPSDAARTLSQLNCNYPIRLTRDIQAAKSWLKEKSRGSERYGIVASSEAARLKPLAIDIKSDVDPVHWFLNGKQDVRSSFYLEQVATQFQVQGLELDWVCLVWDADFRHTEEGWRHFEFKGDRWKKVKSHERQAYLTNAYRVLLTRARQGMVIVVPEGDIADHTREPSFYDSTFEYLKEIGFEII